MIFGWGKKSQSQAVDHAVIIHIPLGDDEFGTAADQEQAFALEAQLEEAVNASGVGEFDGNEFGGGEVVFFIYGPDADALYDVVEPLLKGSGFARAGYAIKRYGEASDAAALETRVTWGGA